MIAIGSRVQRDLEVPGRELNSVHFAMDYLYQRNRWVAKQEGRPTGRAEQPIAAGGKRVVVIGGGDTGMDCVSNALREGAARRMLLDVYPEFPASGRDAGHRGRSAQAPLSTYALDEGGERRFGPAGHRARGRGRPRRARPRPRGHRHLVRNLEAVAGSEFASRPTWC